MSRNCAAPEKIFSKSHCYFLPVVFINLVTVQSQAKFQKRCKMLVFLRLFLKFYLADTPHLQNA
nr:MAG TPA: hypothetical protein [Bacteriophage sp.]